MKKSILLLPLLTACASQSISVPPPVEYTCSGPIQSIQAVYDNSDAKHPLAILKIRDKTHSLHITRSGSGARYTNASGDPARAGDLVWWTKGPKATLYGVTPSKKARGGVYEHELATCTASAAKRL